jgi:hypothetical protein
VYTADTSTGSPASGAGNRVHRIASVLDGSQVPCVSSDPSVVSSPRVQLLRKAHPAPAHQERRLLMRGHQSYNVATAGKVTALSFSLCSPLAIVRIPRKDCKCHIRARRSKRHSGRLQIRSQPAATLHETPHLLLSPRLFFLVIIYWWFSGDHAARMCRKAQFYFGAGIARSEKTDEKYSGRLTS